MKSKFTLLTVLCLLLLAPTALADTKVYTFPVTEIPASLVETAINVPSQDVTVKLTFAGDCTLGCEARFFDYENTYITKIREMGFDYPFKLWQFLFAEDDLTMVNLEGPLTDNGKLKKADKLFVFRGPADFTQVLTQGSVECVTLENNHTLDLGETGRAETILNLRSAGVAYVSMDYVTVLEKDGVRVGFTSSQFSLTKDRRASITAQIDALNKVGCAAIVHSAHMGEEYTFLINKQQKEVTEYVRQRGVDLLIGHHPHVVQGVWTYDDLLAVYSLGNFSFGGNVHPRDFDAVVASVEMRFTDGQLQSQQLTLWPAAISGSTARNDFQPYPVTDKAALGVMRKLQKSSNYELSPYVEGEGAVQPVFVAKPKEVTQDGQE